MNSFQLCPLCQSHVDTNLSHCPVCGSFISTQPLKKLIHTYPEPAYRKIASIKNKQALFVFFTLSMLTVFLLLFLNLAIPTWPFVWTFLILTLVLYVWILITNTILSQVTIGAKLIWQTVASSIVLLALNLAINPDNFWFFSFALPLILFGNLISLLIVILFGKRQPRDDYRFLILLLLLNFGYTLLSLMQFNFNVLWMGYLTFLGGALSVMGIMTIGRKSFIRFIKSWFHL